MNDSRIQRIINQHDPENDVHYTGPRVTWAEAELASAVIELINELAVVKAQLASIRSKQTETARAEACPDW